MEGILSPVSCVIFNLRDASVTKKSSPAAVQRRAAGITRYQR
jgi:hypothetical protein